MYLYKSPAPAPWGLSQGVAGFLLGIVNRGLSLHQPTARGGMKSSLFQKYFIISKNGEKQTYLKQSNHYALG